MDAKLDERLIIRMTGEVERLRDALKEVMEVADNKDLNDHDAVCQMIDIVERAL